MHCRVHRDGPPSTGGRQLPELCLSNSVQHEGQAVGNQHSHEASHCCLLLLREQVWGNRAYLTVKGCHQERQHLLQARQLVFSSLAKRNRTEAAAGRVHTAATTLRKQSAHKAASSEEADLSCCSACHRLEGLRPDLPLPLLEQGLPCSVLPGSSSACLWPLQLQPARAKAPFTMCPSHILLLGMVQATLCLCNLMAWPCAPVCR